MTSGGREVDVGGGVRVLVIERSNDSQDSWGSQDRQYSTVLDFTGKKLALLHTSWLMANAPPLRLPRVYQGFTKFTQLHVVTS